MTIKHDPHLQGEIPLEFDDLTIEEISKKTNKEKALLFLEKYKAIVNPLVVYSDYFRGDTVKIKETFAIIKNLYIRFVVKGEWSERKFVAVLNSLLANRAFLNSANFEENGYNFDKGILQTRRRGRRRL